MKIERLIDLERSLKEFLNDNGSLPKGILLHKKTAKYILDLERLNGVCYVPEDRLDYFMGVKVYCTKDVKKGEVILF